eukprot:Pgem_evm1s16300
MKESRSKNKKKVIFAQGGAGIFASNSIISKLDTKTEICNDLYAECMFGDVKLASCLIQYYGILYDGTYSDYFVE